MTVTTQPGRPQRRKAVGWGIVMALDVLGHIPWDMFVAMCHADGYTNIPMGYFEESWATRPRADGQPARTLFRGGKDMGYVELNDGGKRWAASWALEMRVRRGLRLAPLMQAAATYLNVRPAGAERED
jgi:hypothetical protein